MGCSGSSTAANSNASVWAELKERLPLDRTPEQQKKRDILFQKFDVRGANSLTEADCLAGCRTHLELDKLSRNVPAVNTRAFNAASGLRTRADATDGVDPAEFRLYLQYIREYFELNVMFEEVDTSSDRTVTAEEFKNALPRIEKWGLKVTNPEAEFKKIDKDGNGISFDEFADWAIRYNLDAEKDNAAGAIPPAAPAPAAAAAVAPAPAAAPVEEKKAEEAAPAAEEKKVEEAPAAAPVEEVKPEAAPAPAPVEEKKEEAAPVVEEKKVEEAPAPVPSSPSPTPEEAANKRKAMWADIKARLPRKKTPEQNAARDELFTQFDPNGNGYLSYAEIERGCKNILKLTDFTTDLQPILLRAYNTARNARKGRGAKAEIEDAYVERVEFRLLLVYIYDYFELWVAFDEIDSTNDNKVTLEEFKVALPKFEKWGVKLAAEDLQKEFASIDKNGSGSVTFVEFAEWAINKHLDVDGEENTA